MGNQTDAGKVETTFTQCQEHLLEMVNRQTADSIGPAVAQLVKSLYERRTFCLRRMSAGPQVVPWVAAKGASPELE
jgi:hypothetical protein